ncbi:MAG: DUF1275 domain-containing protein [Clostridia bacterium]|nr:DUF1275 domain-containing protein [Clostridia bacterium]
MDHRRKHWIFVLSAFGMGLFNSYSYVFRGQSFATMETGNMMMFSYYLINGNYAVLYRYVISILSFTVSCILLEVLRRKKVRNYHTALLAVELTLTSVILFLPDGDLFTALANAMGGFVGASHLQLFRTLDGYSVTTTMCTGNLRSLTNCIGDWIVNKDKKPLHGVRIYATLILTFILGALSGYYLGTVIGPYCLTVSLATLLFALIATKESDAT